MASRPPLYLPAPSTSYTSPDDYRRIYGDGRVRVAQALSENPVKEASPSDPAVRPSTDGAIVSRAYGGFSVDPRWLNQLALLDDKILQKEGSHNLELYDAILDDDVCQSAFQQRRLAVISRPWEVDAGDDSPRAKAAAEHLRLQVKQLSWDRICDKMLYGRWYGYGVAEGQYKIGPDGKIWISDIIIPDRKWFGFTNAGELRMRTTDYPEGEAVPPNKFWSFRTGATHDFAVYGMGLAHWCYWPVWFKKNGIKFWAIFLEKFGMPTVLGKFPEGTPKGDDIIAMILAAAAAVGRDSAVAIPENTTLELLAQGRTGDGTYDLFLNQMNDALFRVILSQTGTSKSEAQGLGGSQSNVMKDVRDEVVQSDSDMIHESFNQTFARWLTAWNFGPDVAPPTLYRSLEDQEDLNSVAERDVKLHGIGIRRTKEAVKEIYGDGYELKEEEPPPELPGALPGQPGNVVPIEAARAAREAERAEFAARDPAPLYIERKLKPASGRALLRWAKDQGFTELEPLSELHVTQLYSKSPVDWFEVADEWTDEELRIPEGGPRKVEQLGDEGAIVLHFASRRMAWRHEGLLERGASHDYESFQAHVTFSYGSAGVDLETVEPFAGELIFGPELFEEIETEPEMAFSARELDQIDIFARELATGADPLLKEFAAMLKGKVKGVKDARGLRVALLEALERFPAVELGKLAGLPLVAERAASEAGLEDQLRA
jgi:hypothetical protein